MMVCRQHVLRQQTFPDPHSITLGTLQLSRHTVVCRAAQEAGAPHREYIYRKKVNAIFTAL